MPECQNNQQNTSNIHFTARSACDCSCLRLKLMIWFIRSLPFFSTHHKVWIHAALSNSLFPCCYLVGSTRIHPEEHLLILRPSPWHFQSWFVDGALRLLALLPSGPFLSAAHRSLSTHSGAQSRTKNFLFSFAPIAHLQLRLKPGSWVRVRGRKGLQRCQLGQGNPHVRAHQSWTGQHPVSDP